MTTYKIRWSHGLTERAETFEEAEAMIREVLSAPVIEREDDGLNRGGALVWASEDLADNDDGSRAAARIFPVETTDNGFRRE